MVIMALSGVGCDYFETPTPPPGSMVLSPGYRHFKDQGIDTKIGRISRFGGPQISYEIGGARLDLKRLPDMVSLDTSMVGDDELTIIKQKGNRLNLVFQDASFVATNVRTQRDVDDIVRMVKSYSSPTWSEAKGDLKRGAKE
jgi:hypothetical protein